MPNIILILGILFIALIVMVTLVDRFGKKQSSEEVSRISRWVIPLMAAIMVLQLLAYFFR